MGKGGAMLTPNELVLFWGIIMSVPILVKIDRESASRRLLFLFT